MGNKRQMDYMELLILEIVCKQIVEYLMAKEM